MSTTGNKTNVYINKAESKLSEVKYLFPLLFTDRISRRLPSKSKPRQEKQSKRVKISGTRMDPLF